MSTVDMPNCAACGKPVDIETEPKAYAKVTPEGGDSKYYHLGDCADAAMAELGKSMKLTGGTKKCSKCGAMVPLMAVTCPNCPGL